MNPTIKEVRRATVEDVPKLVELWKSEQLPWQELEKRFKEFQVAAAADGGILGALGLQLSGLEGQMHSEAFLHEDQADLLRDKLWERMRILAGNHGLVRLWTPLAAPFWHTNGLKPPDKDVMARLPAAFGDAKLPRLVLQLKEQSAPAISIEKEFALFQEAEKQDVQRLFHQAKVLKMVALVVAILVALLVLVWAYLMYRARQHLGPQ
jgi:N-acetylglutamate synthase-like GNAT family acetyltransferase